jgi:anti-anti-sigma factor
MRVTGGIATDRFEARADDDGVLWLSGELDIAAADRFVRAGMEIFERHEVLVADLSALTFLDSSGIRALLTITERCQGRAITLRAPSDNVRKVLDLTGIIGRAGISLDES